jgi:adenine-specific DNA-methyltransferase
VTVVASGRPQRGPNAATAWHNDRRGGAGPAGTGRRCGAGQDDSGCSGSKTYVLQEGQRGAGAYALALTGTKAGVGMAHRLELLWPGKDKFLLVPSDESGKPVWVERDHPAAGEVRLTDFTGGHGDVSDDPYADNLMFTGDCLDALRALREVPEYARHYRGKVKLAYCDPPFNTGNVFAHYDDWMEHSTWLSFMRDRLMLIKDLLARDGSVWVHLDNVEEHRMRVLLDEVFGAENFVEHLVVQSNPKGRQLGRFFASSHEHLLVYARDVKSASMVCGSSDNMNWSDFPLTENGVAYRLLPLRNTNKKFNPTTRPNLHYPVYCSADGQVSLDKGGDFLEEVFPVFGDGAQAVWRWGKDKLARESHELFARQVEGRLGPRLDVFQKDFAPTDRIKKFQSIWLSDEVGSTDQAKAEIRALFGTAASFDTPKPERLLQRVIQVGSEPGDIVLDCFAGSGTTAAVAHKMARRWVTVEAVPDTVAEFTAARLTTVVDGHDPGGITESARWVGGGGFRQVTVAASMYELTPVGVMLADWATDARFARAVAGQLGFEWQPVPRTPLCGVRQRMRLAVFDGAVGVEEARDVLAALSGNERVTIVAKVVLAGVEEMVAEHSRGSRVLKAPRDVLTAATRTPRRRGGTR